MTSLHENRWNEEDQNDFGSPAEAGLTVEEWGANEKEAISNWEWAAQQMRSRGAATLGELARMLAADPNHEQAPEV